MAQNTFIDSLNQQAYQRYRENVSEAKGLAYKALFLAKEEESASQTVDSYINLGRCFRLTSQWDSAYLVLKLAINLSQEAGYDLGLMNANNNLGACYLVQEQIEEAYLQFQKSLAVAEKIDNQKGQANALNNLFVIAQERQNYDTAFMFLDRATLVYKQSGDSSGIARVYANKAFLFDVIQEIDSAIFYYLKAKPIQDSQGLIYQQALSDSHIGELYNKKDQFEDALKYYQKALVLFEEIGDIAELAKTYSNIGTTLFYLNKYPEALPYLEKGVTYARQTEIPFLIGGNLVDLANLYRKLNRDDQLVLEILKEAVEQLEGTSSFYLAGAYDGLGHLALKQGKLNEASTWFTKELTIAKEFGEPNSQSNALFNLAYIHEKQNRSQLALSTLRQYQELRDSIDAVETLETINDLNIKYETKKKENENLKLQNDLQISQIAEVRQKELRNRILGISAFIILIGIVGFIYYRYRQRIRIKEQEMELEQERARQEQRRKEAEKLRELDAMKTRFFTNISHEFRTPLTLIIGKNDQLKSSIADPKLHHGFDMVGRNGHRLLDLVNQVLDVAKLEAGGMSLNMARIDAIPFLKHMLYSFESMGEEKKIKLAFHSDSENLDTAFDHKKIERVIFNLLSNAMKFTPEGGNIQMKVKRKEEMLEISISDSGVGIKASQLPYIFDRFYQADSSENQPQPGTGIGLSLVKELVELHDGTIEAKSELNKGTRFIISLPIPKEPEKFSIQEVETQLSPEALPAKTLSENQAPSLTPSKKEQVLLIEDNTDVRAFVKEQILSFGYQVHEAKDGVEGLEKATELIPDLIVSDIMMPRLDGYGVAKGLKENERTSHIPVILLTSKASDESRIAGLELGVDDYLLKPFNAKELEIRMGNLIGQRKRLRERFTSATIIRPNEVSTVSMDQVFLKKVLDSIELNLTNEQFNVEVLASESDMSVSSLNRKLSALIDQTAGKLIRSMRLQRAADLLKQNSAPISEIAYDMGFNSPTAFARSFKQQFGVSPKEYMKG